MPAKYLHDRQSAEPEVVDGRNVVILPDVESNVENICLLELLQVLVRVNLLVVEAGHGTHKYCSLDSSMTPDYEIN